MFLCFFSSVQGQIIRGLGIDLGALTAAGKLGQNLAFGYSAHLTIIGPKILFPLELSLGMSRQNKKQAENTRLVLFPVFLSAVIRSERAELSNKAIPYARFGIGGVFESAQTIHQGNLANFDPGVLLAIGFSKSISRKVSLLLELNYMFIYQKHFENAEYNGNFVSANIGIIYLFHR